MVPEASVGVGSWQNKTQIQQLKSAMQGFDSASFMNFGSCQTKNHNTADLQSESVYTDFPLGSGVFMFFFTRLSEKCYIMMIWQILTALGYK